MTGYQMETDTLLAATETGTVTLADPAQFAGCTATAGCCCGAMGCTSS